MQIYFLSIPDVQHQLDTKYHFKTESFLSMNKVNEIKIKTNVEGVLADKNMNMNY
jgi:hypothetical protein